MSDLLDHLLTPAQKRAKTKEKKKRSMLSQMGIEPPKPVKTRRKRKPMTEEQRAAAAERLAAARAKRSKGKTPNAHPDVLALDPEHPLSYKNTKENLKFWKEKLSSIRKQKDSKEASHRTEFQIAENYVKNLQIWIRDGVYLDHKYGKTRESVMEYVCLTPAMNKDGTIKRTQGVYYPDIDKVWSQEVAKEFE